MVSAAMTNHAVLAGSVLAAVALWAGVYTVLLPKHAPALPAAAEVSVARSVAGAQPERAALGPSRWVDLPRAEPKPSAARAATEDRSAADLPDADRPQTDHRASRRRQIRRAASPDLLIEPHFVRERAYRPRRLHARTRFRRIQEPIQFSLATRSSN